MQAAVILNRRQRDALLSSIPDRAFEGELWTMPSTEDITRLNELLIDAFEDRGLADRLLSSRQREWLLRERLFSEPAREALRRIEADDLRTFSHQSRSLLKGRALSQSHKDYALEESIDVTSYLIAEQFSPGFVRAFDRLLNTQLRRKNDLLVFHFGGYLHMEDLMVLERALHLVSDALIREVPEYTPQAFHQAIDNELPEELLVVDKVTHPASTEIHVIAGMLLHLAAPYVVDLFTDLFASAVYDYLTQELQHFDTFGVRRTDESGTRIEELPPDRPALEDPSLIAIPVLQKGLSCLIETITSRSRYFGFDNGRFVIGAEGQSIPGYSQP